MKKEKARATRTRFSPVMIVMCVILCLYVISLCIPFIWAFITSFKTRLDFLDNPIGLPEKWVWNYGTVFSKFRVMITNDQVGQKFVPLGNMFLNSILYAGGSAIVAAIVPCVTAYLCARFKYKFSKVVYNVVIVTMILPIVGNMPSQIVVTRTLGVYDRIWGMWLANASFLGLYFLVFYNVFKALPKDFTEAAKIDGANTWKMYTKITLPQIAPMILFLALAGWQGGLATFDAVKVLAPLTWSGTAGPENMGLTTSYYIYIQGVNFSHMDYASVMQWAMCIITFIGSYIFLRLRKRTEENL